MKKFFAVVLTVVTSLSLVACGAKENPDEKNPTPTQGVENSAEPIAKNATELLSKIWDSYSEDEKFPIAGGNMEKANMSAPDSFEFEDAETLNMYFGFPVDDVAKIDGAASFMHMMNQNTFTCGAFYVKDNADVAPLSEKIKTDVLGKQWMCGFPDKLVVFNADNYIVSVFGNEELVDNFKAKAIAAFDSLKVVYEEAIE